MKKSTCLLLIATWCIAVLAPVFAVAQKAPYAERFEGVKTVEFTIYHGDLKVVQSTADEVEISGISQSPDEVPVAKISEGKLVFAEASQVDGSSPDWPLWTLKVPQQAKLNIVVSGGNVSLENLGGDINCNLGAGNIQLRQMAGKVEVSTGTGNIDLRACKGHFRGNTGTGNVFLDEVAGTFSFNSGTGNLKAINSQVNGASQLNSGTGQVFFGGNGAVMADLSLNSGTDNTVIEMGGLRFDGTLHLRASKSGGHIEAPFSFDEEKTIGKGKNCNIQKTKKFGDAQVAVTVATGLGTAAAR